MKKIILTLFFCILTTPSISITNLAYLDVQYIIDNSNLGKFYKLEINKIHDSHKSEILSKEKKIKEKEEEFNNQKNLLNQDEIKKKLDEINKLIKDYQIFRNDLKKKITIEKKKYSKEILLILNPLLTKYVDSNNISLVIEKKDVLVGAKSLDITNNILSIFNEKTKNLNLSNAN